MLNVPGASGLISPCAEVSAESETAKSQFTTSKMMAVPPGKTPISYLQEYCTKRGLTPQYDLIANEGAVHEPTFLMRVTVGSVVATGKGSSKKKAKHCAAQAALNQLLGVQNGQNSESDGGETGGEEGVGNPIGELQEFTQKKLMKPPIYEFSNEQGPPHAREFVCTIKLGKYLEKGSGRSKKAAKRNAAAKMMQHIKTMSSDGEKPAQVEESDEEEEIPLGFETKSSYAALKESGRPHLTSTTPHQSKELQLFYEAVMQSSGKELRSAGAPAPSTNYCQMLQEIAEVRRFEVSCFDISERSTSGQYQCLIKLTTNPIAVCHGSGTTMDDSRANAAHNALQYLRIMTKS